MGASGPALGAPATGEGGSGSAVEDQLRQALVQVEQQRQLLQQQQQHQGALGGGMGHARVPPAPLRSTLVPVPPAPLRVAPLRARTGTRECPGTQHKHCLPCICAAVCPQFDTSLLNITAGMVAGLSRPRRVGEGSTLDDFAVSALRRAAQPKTKRARTDGQEAHDVALARDGRLGEAAAAAVAVADGARTLSSKRRARGPVEGITQEYLAHAVNHTCHRDFEFRCE